MLLTFLSKIKPIHLLIIALVIAIGFGAWAWGEIRFQKSESNRKGDNYENLRDMDSLNIAYLTFRTSKEIEEYINSNVGLSKQLEEQNVKIKRLQNIIYQKQRYIDGISRASDVSDIVKDIREDVESKSTWVDSTDCLVIRGDVLYKNDSLTVNVNRREFNNEIAITGSWERNKWRFLGLWEWRFLGRKIATAKATSKCGESETIIIDKTKR